MAKKDVKDKLDKDFYRTSITLDKDTYTKLNEIATNRDESLANVIRENIKKGLASEWVDENKDLIVMIMRQQMEAIIKPHIERLAKLSSKSGHMSATAAFLNVQALLDLVPKENRKNVKSMYDSARKKAVEYMRIKTDDWEQDFNSKE